MAADRDRDGAAADTALVLGGGGPVGMAWELGLLAGAVDSGELRDIALTVGTSAGSAVGAWFSNGSVTDTDVIDRLEALTGELVELTAKTRATSGNATISEAAHVSLFERLVGTRWPSDFICMATDVDTGLLQTWDRRSEVSLGRAVAASCAWPGAFPTVGIAGRRYMDGGIEDAMNARLAAGHDTVVAISCSPLDDDGGTSTEMARQLRNTRRSLDDLKSQGTNLVLIEPDRRFLAISEDDGALTDPSRLRAAHTAGLELGTEVAERFAPGWTTA
jgi:NTE family protein